VLPDEATVAKTPPEAAAAEEPEGAAEVATDAADVAATEPAAPAVPEAPATVLPQDDPVGPTGVVVAVPNSSRESPGAGNLRSVES
jgi:hypothetical protein